jgi:hypothetical protein
MPADFPNAISGTDPAADPETPGLVAHSLFLNARDCGF